MFPHVTSNIQVPFMQPQWPRARASGGGGFVPTDIAGCVLWLPADQITGLPDGDPVATWADQSGNSNDLTQAVSGQRPLYKTAILNGLPVIRFDGVDDALAAFFTVDRPLYLFMVARFHAAYSVGNETMVDGNTTNSTRLFRSNSTTLDTYGGSFGPQATTTPQAWHTIFVSFVSGSGSEMIIDGGAATTGDSGTGDPAGISLGATSSSGGEAGAVDFAEFVAYTANPTAPQRAALQSYASGKYAL